MTLTKPKNKTCMDAKQARTLLDSGQMANPKKTKMMTFNRPSKKYKMKTVTAHFAKKKMISPTSDPC